MHCSGLEWGSGQRPAVSHGCVRSWTRMWKLAEVYQNVRGKEEEPVGLTGSGLKRCVPSLLELRDSFFQMEGVWAHHPKRARSALLSWRLGEEPPAHSTPSSFHHPEMPPCPLGPCPVLLRLSRLRMRALELGGAEHAAWCTGSLGTCQH